MHTAAIVQVLLRLPQDPGLNTSKTNAALSVLNKLWVQTVASAQVVLLSGELFAAPGLDIVPFSLGPLSLADSTTLIQQAAPQVPSIWL